MAVRLILINGTPSGQCRTSSGQISTSVRNPTGINTTLDVVSNIGNGVTPKTSNSSTPLDWG
eukprot:10268810-Ditylum_brightwellii.AAC.1